MTQQEKKEILAQIDESSSQAERALSDAHDKEQSFKMRLAVEQQKVLKKVRQFIESKEVTE